jgi:hypothetical protein
MKRLTREAGFAEKITLMQNAYRHFPPKPRSDGEFDLTFLNVEHSVARCALSMNSVLFWERQNRSAFGDGDKEVFRLEVRSLLRSCCRWDHGLGPSLNRWKRLDSTMANRRQNGPQRFVPNLERKERPTLGRDRNSEKRNPDMIFLSPGVS